MLKHLPICSSASHIHGDDDDKVNVMEILTKEMLQEIQVRQFKV